MKSLQQQLVFSFSVCLVSLLFIRTSFAQEDSEAVVDINGDELRVGNKYYIVSAIWGAGGGGLTLSNYRTGGDCPITVSQEARDTQYGIPCSFHPASASSDNIIRTSQSLNIKFEPESESESLQCANSTVWQIGQLDPYTRSQLVTIEGVEGNPGCNTVNSWFQIEKSGMTSVYKFVFNPSDVCSESTKGGDLTIGFAPGERPLVVSPATSEAGSARPFQVVFRKYEEGQGQRGSGTGAGAGKAYVK